MSKKANLTLGEVMGKKGEAAAHRGVELTDLPDLLGENMPKLEFHAVGRLRLMRALRERFGQNFKNNPHVSGIIAKFDREVETEKQHHEIRKRFGRR